jgi:hypothetical protein
MRRIIPILVLSGLLASCSGASETDITATVPGPSTTPNQFYTSPATGPVGERFLGVRPVQEPQNVIATRDQFYISTGTGPVGERFLGVRPVQEPQNVIATRNQFYISTGTGPVGERFLAAEEAAARFHGNAHRWRSVG